VADTVFTTERLVLRKWREGDLALWLEHLNTPEVKHYLAGVQSADRVAERFGMMVAEWDALGFSFLAVERQTDLAFVGACGIGRVFDEPAPEPLASGLQIGWQIRADMWGHGYATEAARAFLPYAFDSLGLETLWAQTSERNHGSWAVMRKLGMTRRPELDYCDPAYPPEDNPAMVWSLTQEDYRAR
jgi:RimJ/RimL family protein N-acetyltransferase